MKRIIIALVILLSVATMAQTKEQPKVTSEQQQIIDKAKPIQDELIQLKVQSYDTDKLISYYTDVKKQIESKIAEKVTQITELQKEYDATIKK